MRRDYPRGLVRSGLLPPMRQQLLGPTGLVRRQPHQHILQIRNRIMPVEFCGLHQTHHRRRTLARAQVSYEQPVVAPHGDGPELVFDPVVVHGQAPVGRKTRERCLAFEAVVHCLGCG
ncbi:hypothetical protein SDC9_77962 [bioreactor metagenome]|uniref:Uncharacterized protein n=1 Tax=bioreactor metagenome TaxID=1076179 RepID=A0A644YSW6_9ZZZZ